MRMWEELEDAKNSVIREALENLMETTGWSLEEAMDALKIPEKKRWIFDERLREYD